LVAASGADHSHHEDSAITSKASRSEISNRPGLGQISRNGICISHTPTCYSGLI
jgi:hypothetical protein